MSEVDPILATLERGDLVGVEVSCPVHDCDWREGFGSAEVVNEYGVKNVIPRRSRCRHRVPTRVDKIVRLPWSASKGDRG